MFRWQHIVESPDSVTMTVPEGSPDQIVVSSESETPQVDSLEETLQMVAWGVMGIPRNANAALYKYAQAHALGAPLTSEFDVTGPDGKEYRAQGFGNAIAFCEVGDWGNVQHLQW